MADQFNQCPDRPQESATWRCDCGRWLYDKDVTVYQGQGVTLASCKFGRKRCVTIEAYEEANKKERPLAQQLPEVFSYPFRGEGWAILLSGTLFFWLTFKVASYLCVGLLIQLLATGFIIAYLFRVVEQTSQGEDGLPDWPNAGDLWDDIVQPMMLMLLVVGFCFGPAWWVKWNEIFDWYSHMASNPEADGVSLFWDGDLSWIYWPLLAMGYFLYPMVLLLIAMTRP